MTGKPGRSRRVGMKPFIAVIGTRNAGKSTVIRSLTGCRNRTSRGLVTDRSTGKSLYVIASSPQEQRLEPEEFKQIIDTVLGDDSILGLVMAVQPSWTSTRMSMEDIFRAVQGMLSPIAVMLHPPYNDGASPPPQSVQARLKSFGVTLTVRDGRRFAYLNASDTRGLAGIP